MDNPISISINVAAPQAEAGNFGTPAIFEVFGTNIFPERFRTYSNIQGVLEDFDSTHPVVAKASQLFVASPRPASIVVFRLIGENDQVHVISGSNIKEEETYSFYINNETYSYTAAPADTWADVAQGLSGSFAANASPAVLAGVSVTEDGNELLIDVATDNDKITKWFDVGYSPNLMFADDSTYVLDGGWVSQLNELTNNGPAYFSFTIGSLNEADIEAVADWAETREKLFFALTKDTNVLTSATDDIGSVLKEKNLSYAAVLHTRRNGTLAAAASALVAKPAGSLTWKFKQFTGLRNDFYSSNDKTNMINKFVNYITLNRGVATLTEGNTPNGRFIDETRDLAFFRDLLEVSLLNTFLVNDGIPYTEDGFVTLNAAFISALSQAIAAGIFVDGSTSVVFPDIASIPVEQRALREVPGVVVNAVMAAPVHKISVSVNVSF